MRARAVGLFVTGTDTGVGKTTIACSLIRTFAVQGFATVGMKPVAAGARRVGGRLTNGDVEALRRASNVRASSRAINPYAFAAPVAPHLAAESAGVDIRLSTIVRAYRRLAERADVVIVEGAGGLLVPLSGRHDSADLAHRLGLPVVLVVGMRLGCLSHALLTAAALSARGLVLNGWIANRLDPRMRAYRGNVAALERRLDAPLLAELPYRSSSAARGLAIDRALQTSWHLKRCVERLRRSTAIRGA